MIARFSLLSILLVWASTVYGQTPVVVRAIDPTTGVLVDVGDSANTGIRTNCVSGCSAGAKTNNAAAPTNDNIGALTAIASAAAQSYTEGRQVLPRVDLSGSTPTVLYNTSGTAVTLSPVLDPCQLNAKVYTPISTTANVQMITGTAAKKVYICSILLKNAIAENFSIVAGTGTTCGTATVAVIGGATAALGLVFDASSGFVLGDGLSAIAATTINPAQPPPFQLSFC